MLMGGATCPSATSTNSIHTPWSQLRGHHVVKCLAQGHSGGAGGRTADPLMNAAAELPDEGEVEADRELEVQLDGGTLVVAADGVLDLDVDLGRNDRTVSGGGGAIGPFHGFKQQRQRVSPSARRTRRRRGSAPISPRSHSSCSPVAVGKGRRQ